MTFLIILIYIVCALELTLLILIYKRLQLKYDIMRFNYPKELKDIIHYYRCCAFGLLVVPFFTIPMYLLPNINDNLISISASYSVLIFIYYFINYINNILNNVK